MREGQISILYIPPYGKVFESDDYKRRPPRVINPEVAALRIQSFTGPKSRVFCDKCAGRAIHDGEFRTIVQGSPTLPVLYRRDFRRVQSIPPEVYCLRLDPALLLELRNYLPIQRPFNEEPNEETP